MNSTFFILLIGIAYIGLLFVVGFSAEKIPEHRITTRRKALIYSLSIGVYCTTWTFYGAVGSAANSGFNYVAIYLGPIILFTLGQPILKRLAEISFEQKITSLSDFIASRYGKSRALAILISVLATVAIIPYLALQLKGITMSFNAITASNIMATEATEVFYLTIALIIFAIVFGARKIDITEHQHGLMNAIAFESVVKLFSFILVGVFCIYLLFSNKTDLSIANTTIQQANIFKHGLSADFFVQSFLAFSAMLCLPRQFHVTFVEYHHPKDLEYAKKLVPIYLLCFAVLALPIAALGTELFSNSAISSDQYVLSIPLESGQSLIAIIAFIGGLSAGTGMVIVASTALSTMLSNDIFIPFYVKRHRNNHTAKVFQHKVLIIRRFLIAAVLGLAYLCFLWIREARSLANIGLLAFSVVVHFLPAILLGIYWNKANRKGVFSGLLAGALVWVMYFSYFEGESAWLNYSATGYFGYSVLVESTLLSFLMNLLVFISVSELSTSELNEKVQASLFTRSTLKTNNIEFSHPVEVGELYTLASSILGEDRTRESFQRIQNTDQLNLKDVAGEEILQKTELALAGAIGASSARSMILGLSQNNRDLATLISSTADAIRFNRNLNSQVLDNIDQGISVVDHERRLVAWNQSYTDLMQYPEGFLYIGKPLDEIIRFNAERGYCGPGTVSEHINKRMSYLSLGKSYRFERYRDDGIIVDIRGNPLPGGSYVTSYTNITEYKKTQHALEDVNVSLEKRVTQRTEQLQAAMHEAHQATHSKTRFLAAASHDLLQPFNAAKLFTDILKNDDDLGNDQRKIVHKLSASIQSAEDIIDALVEMSKLDRNKLDIEISDFRLQEIFDNLHSQFTPFALQKGLELRIRPTPLSVRTDPKLLHRVLQNLVSNAIRYTSSGGILIAARERNNKQSALISVFDTGIGIDEANQEEVFAEFKRLNPQTVFGAETALGLGLAISSRIADLLGSKINLLSTLGQGSQFSCLIPVSKKALTINTDQNNQSQTLFDTQEHESLLRNICILAIDNEPQIIDAMRITLQKWSKRVFVAKNLSEARDLLKQQINPDLIFADYHLDDNETGIDVLKMFTHIDCEKVIVSADHSQRLNEQISEYEYQLLHKPVSAQDLFEILLKVAKKKNTD